MGLGMSGSKFLPPSHLGPRCWDHLPIFKGHPGGLQRQHQVCSRLESGALVEVDHGNMWAARHPWWRYFLGYTIQYIQYILDYHNISRKVTTYLNVWVWWGRMLIKHVQEREASSAGELLKEAWELSRKLKLRSLAVGSTYQHLNLTVSDFKTIEKCWFLSRRPLPLVILVIGQGGEHHLGEDVDVEWFLRFLGSLDETGWAMHRTGAWEGPGKGCCSLRASQRASTLFHFQRQARSSGLTLAQSFTLWWRFCWIAVVLHGPRWCWNCATIRRSWLAIGCSQVQAPFSFSSNQWPVSAESHEAAEKTGLYMGCSHGQAEISSGTTGFFWTPGLFALILSPRPGADPIQDDRHKHWQTIWNGLKWCILSFLLSFRGTVMSLEIFKGDF